MYLVRKLMKFIINETHVIVFIAEDKDRTTKDLWAQLLKFVQGKKQSSVLSYMIIFQTCKKNIMEIIEGLKESRYILLKDYQIFNTYIKEKMILPLKQIPKSDKKYLENRAKITVFRHLIKDEKFYNELIKTYPIKIKKKQKQRYSARLIL